MFARIGKALTALSIATVVTAATITSALAWSDDLQGKPDSLEAGGDLGYYIWHDDNGLHLRTTGPGPRHVFRARLHTGGEFRNVRLVRLEGDDAFSIHDGGHVMDLRFETWDHIDGVDFHIEGGRGMTLKLRIDGDLADTDQIFLGEDGSHPDDNPFVERR